MAEDTESIIMEYQLVLQFRGDSLEDFDAMVALEDELIKALGNSATVDGHDIGSGEVNIFIFTSDPQKTFEQAKRVLEQMNRLGAVKAAYRPMPLVDENFTVIWPIGSKEKFAIA